MDFMLGKIKFHRKSLVDRPIPCDINYKCLLVLIIIIIIYILIEIIFFQAILLPAHLAIISPRHHCRMQ